MSYFSDPKSIQSFTAGCKVFSVLLQSSAARFVLVTRIESPRCCFLVSLESICSFCFQRCSVHLRLQPRLLILSALSRHVSQPLLVVTTETIDLDQVVVSGLVLGLMENKVAKRGEQEERGNIKNINQSRKHLFCFNRVDP